MSFQELVTSRYSAVNFIEDDNMTEDDFKSIFDLTKMAPSAYNLQFTDYLVITDEAKKERVEGLGFDQYKVHTASAVIIVLGNEKSSEMSKLKKFTVL